MLILQRHTLLITPLCLTAAVRVGFKINTETVYVARPGY